MTEQEASAAGEPSLEHDDLGQMLEEIAADPAARAGYEDALHREELLQAMVAARGTLAQKAVATAMGTTQSAVSDIENGRVNPRLSTLQRYARAVERRIEMRLCRVEVADQGSENTVGESEGAEARQLEEEFKQAQQQVEEHILDDILTHLFREEPKSGPHPPPPSPKKRGCENPPSGTPCASYKRRGG